MDKATFGGGCFWDLVTVFREIPGPSDAKMPGAGE
jgi:peptide methionine sulfoxide reductase MsrA